MSVKKKSFIFEIVLRTYDEKGKIKENCPYLV